VIFFLFDLFYSDNFFVIESSKIKSPMQFRNLKLFFGIAFLLISAMVVLFYFSCLKTGLRLKPGSNLNVNAGIIDSMNNDNKWTRCFRYNDGNIYFADHKMSRDGGKTISDQKNIDLEDINGAPERAVIVTSKLFYALDGPVTFKSQGIFTGKAWRSVDGLKTILKEEPEFYIPEGCRPDKNIENWYGIYVYRTILEISDNFWLMTMYGNFIGDTLMPADKDAQKELEYMMRTIIVTSDDEGQTWHYLSSVAVPVAGEPVGEGFVEPAIAKLNDGRLLCIMRSGHHFPLYASWSRDTGKTWSPPLYTGLDRGCDPCLITLNDGRVALSWGRRFPEGWSKITPAGDKGLFVYPGKGYTSLSVSNDNGIKWETSKIIHNSGSCYSTIFELEPNIVFMQSDQWYCRISLNHGKI
jgi:hypothetical protein